MPSGRSLMPRCSTRRPVGGGSTSPDSSGSTTANALSISVLSARERGTSGRQALAAPYLAFQALAIRAAACDDRMHALTSVQDRASKIT